MAPEPLDRLHRLEARRLHVLVADDNVVNQRVAAGMLRQLGHTSDIAETGVAALAAVAQSGRRYDVVLMDVQMPEMDGLEATAKLVDALGAARPRIIALTACAHDSVRRSCFDVGMDDFLAKPLLREELVAALSRI